MSQRNTLMGTLILVLALGTLIPVSDASAQGEPFMELMRKDIQTDKVLLMTTSLALSDAEGEVFWPIYREYQTDLSTLGDGKIAQIKDYAANYENMTGDKAAELAKTSLNLAEKQLKLLKKTHKKVSKEINPIVAARFLQIEKQSPIV